MDRKSSNSFTFCSAEWSPPSAEARAGGTRLSAYFAGGRDWVADDADLEVIVPDEDFGGLDVDAVEDEGAVLLGDDVVVLCGLDEVAGDVADKLHVDVGGDTLSRPAEVPLSMTSGTLKRIWRIWHSVELSMGVQVISVAPFVFDVPVRTGSLVRGRGNWWWERVWHRSSTVRPGWA